MGEQALLRLHHQSEGKWMNLKKCGLFSVGWCSNKRVEKFYHAWVESERYRQGGCGGVIPASMSLGHALDWEELAAGERPG